MSAYVVAQIRIDDSDEYQQYLAGFMPIFERYDGEILATTRCTTEVVEGTWAYPATVILKFPSVQQAKDWHADADYQALAEHRFRSAKANLAIVHGID